ncbi:4Fe-4S ferredoxin [Maridesulfovibrio sp. FT414]|uniref:4Fe-4S ferredoxin n=1 Tax=Maridesulfovibrio sp. FT414 TaxID=2979469 RepID=UPI003D80872F
MLTIIREIKSWMADIRNNAIEPGSDQPAFDEPLVGFASGADPLFEFLKEDIGPEFYWTPVEALQNAFPSIEVEPEEVSVIAWVLPQTENTRTAHRAATEMPSIEWSMARHYGETVNENLRRFVVDWFLSSLTEACAPVLLPDWSRAVSEKYGYASRWSERHAAYVCGLGTFGLSDGLITPAGKAVRVGSVVVRRECEPTPREYAKHNEWCLFHAGLKCRACMKRCPAGAITEEGHDKVKCKNYIRNFTAVYVEKEQLGFRVNSCGLCQTKVPCEFRNPMSLLEK